MLSHLRRYARRLKHSILSKTFESIQWAQFKYGKNEWGVDVVVKQINHYDVYWPVTDHGAKILKEKLGTALSMRGGLAVPADDWYRYYDSLQHGAEFTQDNPGLVIARLGGMGVTIDPP